MSRTFGSSEPRAASRAPRGPALVVLLVVLVVLPLVVGVLALRRPTWAPVLDLAMTEVRVRDVGTSDSPLVGLPGRIFSEGTQGSHPGPLSFWMLAPVYRLAGASAWALQLGAAALGVVAVALALTFAHRRAGSIGAAAIAAVLSLLVLGYGVGPLLEPWNPYLPLLWWVVALVCTWSVLDGDLPALPVLVLACSMCAQTHIPYLPLCLGLGALAVGALVAPHRLGGLLAPGRWGWLGIAAGIGFILWLPPTIDQAVNEPGNYRVLLDHFATPPEQPVGLRRAATEVLEHFDLGHAVVDQVRDPGLLARGELGRFPVAWRGAVLLVVWAASAAVTWRRAPRTLRALHVTIAASTLLGWYSISRIFGVLWYYLMLWLWAVAALAVVATAWSVLRWWRDGRGSTSRPWGEGTRHRVAAVLIALAAVGTARSVVVAPDAAPSDPQLSRVLVELVDDTARALQEGAGAAPGPDATYIVGFSDALHIGAQAYGLVNELERRGYDVAMHPAFGVPMTKHRTVAPGMADARIQLVTGALIEEWRAAEGAVEVTTVDLRTEAELAELERLRRSVTTRLRDEGLAELIPFLETNLFRAAIDQRASERLRVDMDRMLKIGMPTAVFVAPATMEEP